MRILSLLFLALSSPISESFSRFPTHTSSTSYTKTSSASLTPTDSTTNSITFTHTNTRTVSITDSISLTPSFSLIPYSNSSTSTAYLINTVTPSTTNIVISQPQTTNGLNIQVIISISVMASIIGSMLLFFIILKIKHQTKAKVDTSKQPQLSLPTNTVVKNTA